MPQMILYHHSNQIIRICDDVNTTIVSTTSTKSMSVMLDGKVVQTSKHTVDPFIRPPQESLLSKRLVCHVILMDILEHCNSVWYHWVSNEASQSSMWQNTQRHGVYVITDKMLVQDYWMANLCIPGKSVLVLFCCVLWCLKWRLGHSNTSFELSLPLCACLCKPRVLTLVAITSLSSL